MLAPYGRERLDDVAIFDEATTEQVGDEEGRSASGKRHGRLRRVVSKVGRRERRRRPSLDTQAPFPACSPARSLRGEYARMSGDRVVQARST